MESIEDLFTLWPTTADFAVEIGEGHWTVQKWKQRGRIPSSAWPSVIDAARKRGKKLTADALLAMHETRRGTGTLGCK